MKWIKKGLIFDLKEQFVGKDYIGFAQSPQTLIFPDFIRIYFSTRKIDSKTGKFISDIAFVDFDKDLSTIKNRSTSEVIKLGDLGAFDEHGIFPINVLRHEDKIYAYTCGWSRRVSVSVETSTGIAISNDGGYTFEKIGIGPILTSSLYEPVLVGDSFVKFYENKFHMWYIFGKEWKPAKDNEPAARVYKIAHAVSEDGINWHKDEGKQIISDKLSSDECQALPTVVKVNNTYHMYFCYREATDFRKNTDRGYRLGYAFSEDLINWTRVDELAGIDVSENGWDSEMMCYPHLFELDSKVYLLYNGNEFGRYGFGLAQLESMEYDR